MKNRERISITLSKDVLEEIDRNRLARTRSEFIESNMSLSLAKDVDFKNRFEKL